MLGVQCTDNGGFSIVCILLYNEWYVYIIKIGESIDYGSMVVCWIQWCIDDSGERTPTEYGGGKDKGASNKEDFSLMCTRVQDEGELKN